MLAADYIKLGELLLLAIVVVVVAIRDCRLREVRNKLTRRPCRGAAWVRSFPDATKEEVRNFLDIFVDAFGFGREHRLAFGPADRPMGIYCELYPIKGGADAMEIEMFWLDYEKRYGLDPERIWHDGITLGELFSYCRSHLR